MRTAARAFGNSKRNKGITPDPQSFEISLQERAFVSVERCIRAEGRKLLGELCKARTIVLAGYGDVFQRVDKTHVEGETEAFLIKVAPVVVRIAFLAHERRAKGNIFTEVVRNMLKNV